MLHAQLREATLGDKLKALGPWLRPTPYSSRVWLDGLYLVFIGTVQLAILPSFLPTNMVVDLVTPWLLIGFIRGTLSRTIFMAVLGAFLIETYSAIPSGFYVCSYFVIGVTLYLIRGSLSWRHRLPWFASLVASQAAIIAFEAFVIYLANLSEVLSPMYVLMQTARLALATAFGMYLVDTRWVPVGDEEDIS